MKTLMFSLALTCAAATAQAACFADYKAKKDDPLRLHYGVAEVSVCSRSEAAAELKGRLSQSGWTLLTVLSVFDETGLAERENRAGKYHLRF